LKKGGKFYSFDKHRQFLPLDHAFRCDEVQNVKDLQMLEQLHLGDDSIAPSDSVDYDMVDSDDETYDLANPDHEDYF
jgi:hypothetical protein